MNEFEYNSKIDCSRGCKVSTDENGDIHCEMEYGCCKLSVYDWLQGQKRASTEEFFEVRFKNTHKGFYINDSGQALHTGDIVVVEAVTGHDVGIISLEGALLVAQMKRRKINPETYPFKKIYRKAKMADISRWQEAIAREHSVMIRSRQIAAEMGLEMKIGDVEFQGDGTKAIFYYIADERVDFRKLIKVFASEFKIRIEMRQFGTRQEAGLIGGIGVCGQELCCSRYMAEFISITTGAARCQDLSLNPQKLAGQCSKLKCCINYEAPIYLDAQKDIPVINGPIETEDGPAWHIKTDILRKMMFFSYDKNSMSNLIELSADEVKKYLELNKKGIKVESLLDEDEDSNDFKSAVGEGSITRFDKSKRKKHRNKGGRGRKEDSAGSGMGTENEKE